MTDYTVFDGHNDFLFRYTRASLAQRKAMWIEGEGAHHLDLPRMQAAGFVGGFFAIWVPSPDDAGGLDFEAMMEVLPYDLPMPPLLEQADALPTAMSQAAGLFEMERLSGGDLTVCRSGAEVRRAVEKGKVAAILHMEGAEAIGPDLSQLEVWYRMGLRSIGPVWSRPTIYGEGVPFAFPSTPDRGAGLTDLGKELIRECDRLGILIDLSHLNEKGFDDVAAISSRPLIATHSNAHAVTPSSRNLTNRQLAMIAESNGIVGLNFGCAFLREDGRRDANTGFDRIMAHLDHLIGALGEDRVALGSDFDGAVIPSVIGDVLGLPDLIDAMIDHGYDPALVSKISSGNWMSFLDRNL